MLTQELQCSTRYRSRPVVPSRPCGGLQALRDAMGSSYNLLCA